MEINDNDKEINSAWHVHEDGTVHAHHGHTKEIFLAKNAQEKK